MPQQRFTWPFEPRTRHRTGESAWFDVGFGVRSSVADGAAAPRYETSGRTAAARASTSDWASAGVDATVSM